MAEAAGSVSRKRKALSQAVPIANRRRVLVACHPKPFDTHWQKSVVQQASEALFPGDTIVYETIDIKNNSWGEPDHLGDVFGISDSAFIDSHQKEFDAVWYPDCSGPWWDQHVLKSYLKNNRPSLDENVADEIETDTVHYLQRMVFSGLGLVRPGGSLFFGKLVNGPEETLATFRSLFLNNPATPEIQGITLEERGGLDYYKPKYIHITLKP